MNRLMQSQLVAGEVVEPLGGETRLARVGHWGQDEGYSPVHFHASLLFPDSPCCEDVLHTPVITPSVSRWTVPSEL